MLWKENIKIALRNLKANLLRSILTMTIIAVGIASLVGILTAIDTLLYSLSDSFSSLGANSFTVSPVGGSFGGRRNGRQQKRGESITLDQALQFQEKISQQATATVSLNGTSLATIRYRTEETNPNVRVTGIDEYFLKVNGKEIEYGRNFISSDISSLRSVCLVGVDIIKDLFNDQAERALGQAIDVNGQKAKIIGVLADSGSGAQQSSGRVVYLPLLLVNRQYASAKTNYTIVSQVSRAEDLDPTIENSIGIMRNIRKLRIGEENDFEVEKSEGALKFLKENTTQIRIAAIVIAMMTILGAAIGLMNIMLVSVTERTREIGVIKALGAKRSTIMSQFLMEAIGICLFGGIMGIIFGILIGNAVTIFVGGSFLMPWNWILGGIVTCIAVGLLAGYYPARKAAYLDPIESLRYE